MVPLLKRSKKQMAERDKAIEARKAKQAKSSGLSVFVALFF